MSFIGDRVPDVRTIERYHSLLSDSNVIWGLRQFSWTVVTTFPFRFVCCRMTSIESWV